MLKCIISWSLKVTYVGIYSIVFCLALLKLDRGGVRFTLLGGIYEKLFLLLERIFGF